MSGSYRLPAEVSFPNCLARQVLFRVHVANAGISQKPSRDYKSSFLIRKEFLKTQDDMPVFIQPQQAIANGLGLAMLVIVLPEPVENDAAD